MWILKSGSSPGRLAQVLGRFCASPGLCHSVTFIAIALPEPQLDPDPTLSAFHGINPFLFQVK